MIHLGTNFLIQALVLGSGAETKLQTWLVAGEDLGISTIRVHSRPFAVDLNSYSCFARGKVRALEGK